MESKQIIKNKMCELTLMKKNKFFNFSSKLVSSNFRAPPLILNVEDAALIEANYNNIDFPVIFKQTAGKKLNDIIDTEFTNLYLISNRMRLILEEYNLTGWKLYPIKLYYKDNSEISGYHGFSITGRCGPKNYKNSKIIEKRYIPNGPLCRFYKGVTLDQWDGSDFCIPEGTIQIIITERAANVLKNNKISNLDLEDLAEKETDVDNVKLLPME